MRPRLETRHLEMLRTLETEPTLADAARALNVTPSALSHRIKEAERRLDVLLFERVGRTLRRTPAGDILLEAAKRLLDDLAISEQYAVASSAGTRHFVRLTVANYNCYHWLPAFLDRFRDSHPEIELDIEGDRSLHPFDLLAEDAVDVIVTPSPRIPRYAEETPLFADELVAIVAPAHELAEKPSVSADDLATETYYTYSFEREPGFEADRVWTPAGVRPVREIRIGYIGAICEMVRAGLGVSILSRWALEPRLETGELRAVPLGEGVDIRWRAATRADQPEDAPARIVARALADWFGEG
ncbi:MAG: LysR substrate-binding domain-containing protein [Pseudomonadota bacterium]